MRFGREIRLLTSAATRLIIPEGDLLGDHLDAVAPRTSVVAQTATLRYELAGIEAVATVGLEGASVLATLRISNGSQRIIQ